MTWPSVALSEVAKIERNGISAEQISSGTSYLGLEHIESGGAILGKVNVANGDLASTKFVFTEQHLLYGKLRPYLAKIALPDFGGVCSTDIVPVLPGPHLDRRFLAYYLRQPAMVEYANSRATGANLPRLSPKSLAEVPIPLPPLDEQRRIAGILDQADALRRLRARALDKLNTLGQAIFHEMFGGIDGPSEVASDHRELGDIADVVSGVTKGRKVKGQALREVPYLAVSNVQDRFLKLDVVKTLEATEDEINRFKLLKDDILLTEGGDPDKLGRGTLWSNELPECIHQNHVFRVRVKTENVRPVFLSWQLGSPAGKAYFLSMAKQTTGIASINKTQLKGFPVSMPPLHQQIAFEERLQHIARHERQQRGASRNAETLFASLQHRAFRGDL